MAKTSLDIETRSSVCGISHKIWIDLDNSPHVPFFVPIIEELRKSRYELLLTSRDNAQVLELLRASGLECNAYGRHYGKNKIFKVLGLGARALQLAPSVLREKPVLAVSHGSRSQIVLSSLLRIPSLVIMDYEHAKLSVGGIRPKWMMMPEIVFEDLAESGEDRILKYPGIKEDVYVPRFNPVPGIREELGISGNEIMVTVRPPASDAHYHSNESDELFLLTIQYLCQNDRVRVVMLPRNRKQEEVVRQQWSDSFRTSKIVIPSRVVDGLNLIWFSDLVISGGGTMNREAAALGVPVYSIFRGKFGAIDRYLCSRQRMVSVATKEDLQAIPLVRREPPKGTGSRNDLALSAIVKNIISTVEMECHPN